MNRPRNRFPYVIIVGVIPDLLVFSILGPLVTELLDLVVVDMYVPLFFVYVACDLPAARKVGGIHK